MWPEDLEDISVEYEENGVLLVKQEAVEVISRGGWPVLLFSYREMDQKTGDYGRLKFSLRKYRKRQGVYRPEAKFNIGNAGQAVAIAKTLMDWAKDAEDGADADE